MKIINMEGQKYNRLTVIKRYYKTDDKKTFWLCECECGNEVIAEGYQIRKGYSKSCGCYTKERVGNLNKSHGKRNTHLYSIYTAMKSRCNNPNNATYVNYGGRGIKVCDEWDRDFQTFYDWAVTNGYKRELTLDREDVNKGYLPDNCRWVTMEAQQNNRRDNIHININGEVKTVSELAEEQGVPYNYIYSRYFRDYAKERARAKELADMK